MNEAKVKKMVEEMVKKYLRISIDTDTHVFTNKPQVLVSILWDGKEIDNDQITLN